MKRKLTQSRVRSATLCGVTLLILQPLTPVAAVEFGMGDCSASTPGISIVSISANQSAYEANLNSGTFIVSRTADTSEEITVPFFISGTAQQGTDFDNIQQSVSFSVGETEKIITIYPIDDALSEATETVTISLALGLSYILGEQITDTIELIDNDASVFGIPKFGAQPAIKLSIAEIYTGNARQNITFSNPYSEKPIVILGPPTDNDQDPGVARINAVNSNGFSIRFQEFFYLDKIHADEQLDYLAVAAGTYTLVDPATGQTQASIEVGNFNINGTKQWKTHYFSTEFPQPPMLFVTLQTTNGGDAVSARVRSIESDSFQAALYEAESKQDSGHIPEELGYFAIYQHLNDNQDIDANNKTSTLTLQQTSLNHNWQQIGNNRQLRLQEDSSHDDETVHVREMINIMLIGNRLFSQISSDVGADPIVLRKRTIP